MLKIKNIILIIGEDLKIKKITNTTAIVEGDIKSVETQ